MNIIQITNPLNPSTVTNLLTPLNIIIIGMVISTFCISFLVLTYFKKQQVTPITCIILQKIGERQKQIEGEKDKKIEQIAIPIYQVVGKKKITSTNTSFTFKKRQFVLDLTATTYIDKHSPVIFYDLDVSHPLSVDYNSEILTKKNKIHRIGSESTFKFYKTNTIEQLVRGTKTFQKMDWTMLIFIVILGIGVGISIGFILYPSVFPNAVKQVVNGTQTLIK